MRPAALSLALLVLSPSSSASSHNHNHRSGGLFRDIGIAISELVYHRHRSAPPPQPRKVVKRASAVNAKNQCILRPVNGGLFHNGTTTSSTSTAGGSSTTSSGSSSSSSTTKGASSSSSSSSSSTTKTTSTTTSKTSATPTPSPSSPWSKQFDSSGSDFFSSYTFFTDTDPTHGTVTYTSQADAQAGNLIDIDDNGYAIMRVDTTPVVTTPRKSVRIESTASFTGGLWVLDALHMPSGCGTWPAFWTHGPAWPQNGEIDILEGANNNQWNMASLHVRDAGCALDASFGGTGQLGSTVCASSDTSNQGCGIVDPDPTSYGAGFNQNKGGVYAMLWDATGIRVWFFPRSSIPKDITSEAPNPTSWPTPFAIFPASTCAPFTYNQDHTTIFDTTLCGDWAGQSWAAAPNGGGQSCAQITGVPTCEQYVANNGAGFSEAYWQVKSVKIYQENS